MELNPLMEKFIENFEDGSYVDRKNKENGVRKFIYLYLISYDLDVNDDILNTRATQYDDLDLVHINKEDFEKFYFLHGIAFKNYGFNFVKKNLLSRSWYWENSKTQRTRMMFDNECRIKKKNTNYFLVRDGSKPGYYALEIFLAQDSSSKKPYEYKKFKIWNLLILLEHVKKLIKRGYSSFKRTGGDFCYGLSELDKVKINDHPKKRSH